MSVIVQHMPANVTSLPGDLANDQDAALRAALKGQGMTYSSNPGSSPKNAAARRSCAPRGPPSMPSPSPARAAFEALAVSDVWFCCVVLLIMIGFVVLVLFCRGAANCRVFF